MFKKKALLTAVAAGALLVANPSPNKAEAATSPTTQTNVYTYKVTSTSDFHRVLESIYRKYGIKPVVTTKPAPTQTVQQPVTTTPTQQQPVTSQPTSTAPAPSTSTATYSLSAYEQKVVDLTNQERAKAGLVALKVDTALSKVAREKSRDMSANNYFSHTSPTYGSPFDMMKKYGITYRAAGENIAKGQRTPEEVVTAWMNSDGHRKNILSSNFTHIGVGHIAQGNYWTQQFIGK